MTLPLELLLGLSVLGREFAELAVVQNQGSEDVLVDSMNFVKATVFVDCRNHTLEQIAEDFGGLEWLKLALVHWEILGGETVEEVFSHVLSSVGVISLVVEQAVLVESKHARHFC